MIKSNNTPLRALRPGFAGPALIAITLSLGHAVAAVPEAQETFTSPQQAVDAFVAADRNSNTAVLAKILGSEGTKLIQSGDPVADRTARRWFAASFDMEHTFEYQGADKAILDVGPDDWPLPIPLVREGGLWHFDTKMGEEEILNRRIGRNELNVIDLSRDYVEAQREYAALSIGGKKFSEYAQKIVSTPGKHDGLYWPASRASDESPIGPLVAAAQAEGYAVAQAKPSPYHGYNYRILTHQGKNAPGGAKNYVVNGHMVSGFALLAFPATYGDSGIMTFIVSQDGIVFEKNLGPDTAKIARQMTEYDPDQTWKAP
jgi:hypothetical protein